MPTLTKAEVTQATNEIRDLISSDEVLAALRDRQALREAKADPRGFLKKRGVAVPRSISIHITIKGCVKACKTTRFGTICVEVCVDIETSR